MSKKEKVLKGIETIINVATPLVTLFDLLHRSCEVTLEACKALKETIEPEIEVKPKLLEEENAKEETKE